MKDPYHQVYAIFTLCRTLYLAFKGEVASKSQAALWVKNTYPNWSPLIELAKTWKPDHPLEVVPEIQNFIKFTAGQVAIS